EPPPDLDGQVGDLALMSGGVGVSFLDRPGERLHSLHEGQMPLLLRLHLDGHVGQHALEITPAPGIGHAHGDPILDPADLPARCLDAVALGERLVATCDVPLQLGYDARIVLRDHDVRESGPAIGEVAIAKATSFDVARDIFDGKVGGEARPVYDGAAILDNLAGDRELVLQPLHVGAVVHD